MVERVDSLQRYGEIVLQAKANNLARGSSPVAKADLAASAEPTRARCRAA